jgi:hypothetical protein
MTDYVVTCVDRASGGDPEHSHVYQAFVRPVQGGMGRLLPVKDIRREIKLGYHHFLSEDEHGQRVPVKRYKCICGIKTIRTKPDDLHDSNLSLKGPCT